MAEKLSKLKPCPFCGRKAEEGAALLAYGFYGKRQWDPCVGCERCQVRFVRSTHAAARRAWNRRHRG